MGLLQLAWRVSIGEIHDEYSYIRYPGREHLCIQEDFQIVVVIVLSRLGEMRPFEPHDAVEPEVTAYCLHVRRKLLLQAVQQPVTAVSVLELCTHVHRLATAQVARKEEVELSPCDTILTRDMDILG